MYLEKLKIFGFKSFGKKTILNFNDGTTGIVGPNGCGKSNIVDAIRWVLGEQRTSTLRSDRMENVIFNGSKDLKPLGMAEVSLIIQNTKNVLPIEYSEVVITRRLFRSGESQYLLNNSVCRLKDITDLLMDTGMAADAYSVIELSMVESILSGKPEERRRIFEEAAGITKYKQRRRISTRKLESTETDLIRISDISSEVESKVVSLRRQVKRAQRYQEIQSKLSDMEIQAATYKYSKIYGELEPLKKEIEEKNRERETSTAQISFKEAKLESEKTKLIELEQKLRQSQQELNQVNGSIRNKEEEILVNRERVKSLNVNNERIEQEIKQLQNRTIQYTDTSKKLAANLSALDEKLAASESEYNKEKEVLDRVEKEFKVKQAEGIRSATEMRQFLEQVSEYQSTIENLKGSLSYLASRIDELEKEKSAINQKLSSDDNELNSKQQEYNDSKINLEKLNNRHRQLTIQSEEIDTEINRTKDELADAIHQRDSLQQRVAILNKLLENYADYPEGVKHIIAQQKSNARTIADLISVPQNYQTTIETILGEAATYLIVENDEQAFLGIKSLKDSAKGFVTFLPLSKFQQNSLQRPTIEPSADIIGWADELISCELTYQPLFNVLIGDYLVIKDLSVLKKNPTLESRNSINIVTLNGEMITKWGGIKGGKKSSDKTSYVGRRDQLEKLQHQILEIETAIDNYKEKKVDLENQYASTLEQKKKVQQEIQSSGQKLSDLTLVISQIQYKSEQLRERIQAIENEINSLNKNIHTTRQKITNSEQEVTEIKQQRISTDGDITVLNKDIEKLNTDREKILQSVQHFQIGVIQLKNDINNSKSEIERCKEIVEESNVSVKAKYAELEENNATIQQISDRNETLSEMLADEYSQKEKLEEVVTLLEQQQFDLKKESDEKEKIIRELRSERESFFEAIHAIELRIAELKLNADNLFRRIGEEYNIDLKREQIDETYNLEEDELEIERLKQRLKNLGPVNLLALKEYEAQKERFDFLKKQQEDLIEAEQNLKDTITHINKTAREKFQDVFQIIQENFSDVFTKFFPEGEAHLLFSESDDPLDANIEIVANPKGKRPTSLTLLSGGEKALTAISLLFAIYLVKPSPFCILDEVDAPLDDRNVDRFTATLREFALNTQFLIVTHNKLTMKATDCLYGITMETPGISKVVSVKLD